MKNGIGKYNKHYYTGNHLSSTQLVTDGTGVAIQQVEYAPFGEVVNEYNIDWSSGQVPDFKFNGKELDEENGMYYFEARYHAPPSFISRDVLFEEKPWMSPYAYCSNSPVTRIDPSGMSDGDYHKWNGDKIGTDGKNDNKIHIVSDRKSIKTIRQNDKHNKITDTKDAKIDITITKGALTEVLDVYDRAVKNGGNAEEASVVSEDGKTIKKSETGTSKGVNIPSHPADGNWTSIHSHPLGLDENNGWYEPYKSFAKENEEAKDEYLFKNYILNIIVGHLKPEWSSVLNDYDYDNRQRVAVFYDQKAKQLGQMSLSTIRKIINPWKK
ncbi:MAG: RHS repeat-associated core domain-containing protein [Bacteroidales bacterium]|jgi:RHS repeat-associated protein|nr:RHS repeat-associated core domain-containing protein [Bacteroidales bacterium]